jgi:gamma-glutamyltranspeptidase
MKAGEIFKPARTGRHPGAHRQGRRQGFYEGKTADLLVAQMARGPQKG